MDAPYGPAIVVKQDYINQSASTSPVTVFTPTEDGEFRISAPCDGLSGLDCYITVAWTNASGSHSTSVGGSEAPFEVVFHATSGNPITTAYVSNTGLTCSAYVTLERV